jgi:predicted metalloprotease with PDZ domain
MRRALVVLALLASGAALAQTAINRPIPATRDAAYPGIVTLAIDATDLERRIFRVRQSIPVVAPGPMALLFPEWLPGNHAPRGQIEKLAGLVIRADGKVLHWRRDPVEVYAFHIDVPAGARTIEASFEFVSATDDDQGRVVVTDAMMNIQWQSVSLYPAGWATRGIPVSASVTYPAGWKAATALRPAAQSGSTVRYQSVDYETLIDSPVFAGRHFTAWPLGNGVTLNLVADEARSLVARPEQIAAHKRLVDEAVRLFGSRPFDHYDFLVAATDEMGSIGLEHHRSSENGVNPGYFTEWEAGPGRRNLLPHEFTHSWNGKYRRPIGQIVSDFRTPLENSLLWVYEGQTQFWGYVLGARSGLFSKDQTLDALAAIAANQDLRRARDWRSLDDTTYDPILTPRRPKAWVSWQRSEDYYNEGLLIWLEIDGLIRKSSNGARGLDDFARRFFAGRDGDFVARGYDYAEVVATLNAVQPGDWANLLTRRLTEKGGNAPLAGLDLGGYRLVYGDEPNSFVRDAERRSKDLNLSYSLGFVVGKGNKLSSVVWDGPAFNAGLPIGTEMIAVNGIAWSDDAAREAILAAKSGDGALRLLVKNGKRFREVTLNWKGGLRYPRLMKTGVQPGSIDLLLTPKAG